MKIWENVFHISSIYRFKWRIDDGFFWRSCFWLMNQPLSQVPELKGLRGEQQSCAYPWKLLGKQISEVDIGRVASNQDERIPKHSSPLSSPLCSWTPQSHRFAFRNRHTHLFEEAFTHYLHTGHYLQRLMSKSKKYLPAKILLHQESWTSQCHGHCCWKYKI